MSDLELPAWLAEALAGTARHHVPAPKDRIEPGDLRRLVVDASGGAPADARLLLVLDVDPDAGVASVMLTHTDDEIRTSLDVLVAGDELGLAFGLAMETDLVGPVALRSLEGSLVATVPGDLLGLLRDAVDCGEVPDELLDRVGMPLRGSGDARWTWKVSEGEALDRLLDAHAPAAADTVSPVRMLADALRAIGTWREREDDDDVVTDCMIAFMTRRETPPARILVLLAQPPIAAALGPDMMRAVGPLLRVA